MNTLYAFAGIVLVLCFAIWYLRRVAHDQGRAEAEAELNKRMVELAEKQGGIIAEHREPGDASKRLRDGTF